MQKARIYSSIIKEHLEDYQQMVFLSGPRQAGKTTVSLMAEKYNSKVSYFNWDNLDHKKIILEGVEAAADNT